MGSNISTLGQALDQIARLKTQQANLDELTTQLSSGRRTRVFSGLGTDVLNSKRARAGIGSLDTYINNIKNADRRLTLMTSSLSEMKRQAENISGALSAPQQGDFPDLDVVQKLVTNVKALMKDLINSQDGDRYLFSGADSTTQPIDDNGLFASFLGEFLPDETDLDNPPLISSGAIGDWADGTITTDQFIASYRAASDTVIGYSASLSNGTAGKVTVRVSDKSEIDYTSLGNTAAIKDIMIVLNVLEKIPPVEYAPGALNADVPVDDPVVDTFPEDNPPFPPSEKQQNFFQVINDLASMLNNAIDELDQERFKVANAHSQVKNLEESSLQQKNTLQNIVSNVEDIDLTETAAKINALQIQLEASFRVTAVVSELSLARFLGTF